jgi:hypothetical protein
MNVNMSGEVSTALKLKDWTDLKHDHGGRNNSEEFHLSGGVELDLGCIN